MTKSLAKLDGHEANSILTTMRQKHAKDFPVRGTEASGKVFIVFDCSISMNGDKIQEGKKGAQAFAGKAFDSGYAVGLVSFSTQAQLRCPVTLIPLTIINAIEALQPDGWTNLAAGIQKATEYLGPSGPRSMVIVTDGYPCTGPVGLPWGNTEAKKAKSAAAAAKSMGIDIITIGTNDADTKLLAKIASRNDLAMVTNDSQLGNAIVDAARLLPSVASPETLLPGGRE